MAIQVVGANPQDNRPPVAGEHDIDSVSLLDIDRPEILSTLYRRNGDRWKASFFRWLQAMCFSKGVSQETVTHYEDDHYHRRIRLGAAVVAGDGAAGALVTLTLDVADVYTDASGQSSIYPRVGDIVKFPPVAGSADEFLAAHVVAVNPAGPSIDVRLSKTAWDLPALPIGTTIIIDNGAFAEGSAQPTGAITNIRKRTIRLQTFKETVEGTGHEKTQGKWFTRESNGKEITAYWKYVFEKAEYRMLLKMDGAFMFGHETDNTNIVDATKSANNRRVFTTKGLIPTVNDEGNVLPYTTGSFDLAHFDEAAQINEYENAGNTMCVMYAFQLGQELENVLVDFTKDTEASFLSGDQAARMVKIGFQGIYKQGCQYVWKKIGSVSNTQTYASPGFEQYQNFAVVMPMKMGVTYDNPDTMNEGESPACGYYYKTLDGYNRAFQTWDLHGTGHKKENWTREEDTHSEYIRGHIGLGLMSPNQFQYWPGEQA